MVFDLELFCQGGKSMKFAKHMGNMVLAGFCFGNVTTFENRG
jgi:hypothetical protein